MGNELVGDDGIGIRLGRALLNTKLPSHISVILHTGPLLDLIDSFTSNEHIIFVDASKTGKPPGTCSVVSYKSIEEIAQKPYCCHAMSLSEVFQVARKIYGDTMPQKVDIVIIEAANLDSYTVKLSTSVYNAVPGALKTILKLTSNDQQFISHALKKATNSFLKH